MSSSTLQTITAVLPARNEEETIEAAVRSLAAQPEIAEIRVVNDASSDRTGEILARLTAEFSQLRIVGAGPLPAGWVGKNYAAWLGAQDAATDWLLFADADVTHLPRSAARALEVAGQCDAALVSFSPQQRMETWWERSLIPFVFVRLADLFSYDRVNDPSTPDAAANGQYLLVRTHIYNALGGHRAIAGAVLEDVALAHAVKATGGRLHFAPGGEIAETRMYRSFQAMWQGWIKNLYPLTGGSLFATLVELVSVSLFPVAALVLFAFIPWYPMAAGVAVAALGVQLLRYAGGLHQNRFPASCILYWGPGLVLYAAALVSSARRYSAGSVAWKGRTYPVRP